MYDSKKNHSNGVTITAYWLYFQQVYEEIQKGESDLASHLIAYKVGIWGDIYPNI